MTKKAAKKVETLTLGLTQSHIDMVKKFSKSKARLIKPMKNVRWNSRNVATMELTARQLDNLYTDINWSRLGWLSQFHEYAREDFLKSMLRVMGTKVYRRTCSKY